MGLDRRGLIALGAALLVAALSLGRPALAQSPDSAARGAALFDRLGCVACHGAPGAGGTSRAADVSRSALGQMRDGGAALFAFMGDMTRGHPDLNGRPSAGVPAIPPVSQAQAADLIAAVQVASGKANAQRGLAEAPAIMAASGAPCRVTDALFLLNNTDKKTRTSIDAYEVACDAALGRVALKTVTAGKTTYEVRNCFLASAPYADGKPNQLSCRLPGNRNLLGQLAPYLERAGVACAPRQARSIGVTADAAYVEVACENGRAYVVGLPATLDPAGPTTAVNCLAQAVGGPTECRLSSREAMLAALADPLLPAADGACRVKGRRYVATSRGDEYYEIACVSGAGFMIVADARGAYKSRIDCANAEGVAGGCKLTDVNAVLTADNGRYTQLAKAAGHDCVVSGYRAVASNGQDQTVELACSNRADGAMAQFTGAGAARIFNCAAAETLGYRCGLTREDAAYPALTAAVKKTHPTSTCQVSASRFLGVTPDGGFVEVACADREPGYVLQYAKATAAPTAALYCSQLSAQLGVACGLPGNAGGTAAPAR